MTETSLKDDPVLPGQEWVVLSFLNPEDQMVKKSIHYLNNFLTAHLNNELESTAIQISKYVEAKQRKALNKLVEDFAQSANEVEQKASQLIKGCIKDLLPDEQKIIEEARREYQMDENELLDRYRMYLTENRTLLDREYTQAHGNQTNMRGIKVRGVYPLYDDAKARANFLRDHIEPLDVYVAPMFKWLPLDFYSDEVKSQDHQNKELQKLMDSYYENMNKTKQYHQERLNESREQETSNRDLSRRERQRRKLQKKYQEKRNEKLRKEIEQSQQALESNQNK